MINFISYQAADNMKTMYKNLIHLLLLLPFFLISCDDEAPGKLIPINLSPAASTVGAEGGIVTVRTDRLDWWLEGVTEIHDGEKMPYRNNGYEEINGINTPYPEMSGDWYTIQKKEEYLIVFDIEPNTTGKERVVEVRIAGISLITTPIRVTQTAE